ncbi:MAG: DNA-binding domain-containing protein [Gallionella sp.]|nr:DNA-binding domain-containing protein [Gallionella sp.]MDD4947835.1 DNA-binding domain-containing protein [Gallionella sp.]MDD5612876.1 DNA-binding domain-containing protein [Gallionella sp.]
MTHWTHTLAQFSSVIRNGADFAPGEIICPNYSVARGVEVYRNNYRGNLHDTLAGAYPVMRLLVGEDFFRVLAKCFIEQHPSRSGNLHRYGGEMAAFLTHFERTRHLPYLPDMARLEWAYHHAYFADDLPPFDLSRLASVAPDSYGDLLWKLHPGCTLLTSDYPLSQLWLAHQAGVPDAFDINMNEGGEHVLVHRNEEGVELIHIAPASCHWLLRLQRGLPMGVATEATISDYPDFDLATALRHYLAQGVLVGFDIAGEEG